MCWTRPRPCSVRLGLTMLYTATSFTSEHIKGKWCTRLATRALLLCTNKDSSLSYLLLISLVLKRSCANSIYHTFYFIEIFFIFHISYQVLYLPRYLYTWHVRLQIHYIYHTFPSSKIIYEEKPSIMSNDYLLLL